MVIKRTKAATLATEINNVAAFLLPALALWLPSGSSYSAILILLGTLFFARLWIENHPSLGTIALAVIFLGMAVLGYTVTTSLGVARFERPLKWLLGALCLFYVVAFPPRPIALFLGLPIGCIGMGMLALWQVYGEGMERATGYTNAAPWGDTALLLATFSGVYAIVFGHKHGWLWRNLHLIAVIFGTGASLLSGTRGGWLAMVFVFPMLMIIAFRLHRQYFWRIFTVLNAVAIVFTLVLTSVPVFRDRMNLVFLEIDQYSSGKTDSTSLGIRLEQYRLAVDLISEKPLLGWGVQDFEQETANRVAGGYYDGAILGAKSYIHNELLDNWVKAGVGGALMQLLLYGCLLFIFWPTEGRLPKIKTTENYRQVLVLRIMGCLMGVMYFGFGLTVPYFLYSSSSVFFIFFAIFIWSALQGINSKNKSTDLS